LLPLERGGLPQREGGKKKKEFPAISPERLKAKKKLVLGNLKKKKKKKGRRPTESPFFLREGGPCFRGREKKGEHSLFPL